MGRIKELVKESQLAAETIINLEDELIKALGNLNSLQIWESKMNESISKSTAS